MSISIYIKTYKEEDSHKIYIEVRLILNDIERLFVRNQFVSFTAKFKWRESLLEGRNYQLSVF